MNEAWVEKVVLKLVGNGVLAYALRPDGTLSVVDHKGQKHLFGRQDYEHLLLEEKRDKRSAAVRGRYVQS